MELNKNTVIDGWTRLPGGTDSGNDPTDLTPLQCAFLVNGTFRGKYPRNRPVFMKRTLQFVDENGDANPALQAQFEDGIWQHGSNYAPLYDREYPIVVIGGRFYKINLDQNYIVNDITPGAGTPDDDPNPSNRLVGWSGQGEQFWVFNDSQTLPFIWDGSSGRRAAAGEIRPGRQITASGGRFWYALPDRIHFRATDLTGSSSGTPGYRYTDAILKETENTFLNEGGDFSVPSNSGGITAMRSINQLDASMGNGPLQVFCANLGFSVNAPTDRTTWKNLTYPIFTESIIQTGAFAQDSTITVNSDLWMRSSDGLRSFIIARREFSGSWGNTPQSFEMSRVLDYDQVDLLAYSKAQQFDQRLLVTTSPGYSDHGIFNRGFVALDFVLTGSLQSKGNPAYDGLWTGLRILQPVISQGRCFIFILSQENKIEMWELLKDTASNGLDNGDTPIAWELQSRALFGADIFNLKELYSADLSYDQLYGTTAFNTRFRPDSYPCWVNWHNWTECVDSGCPMTRQDCPPQAPRRQGYRPKYRLPEPPENCIPAGVEVLGQNYQVSIQITGPARLKGFRAKAHVQEEAKYDPSCEDEPCSTVQCCEDDLFSYSAESGIPYPYGQEI
jgi:hypothetical protein